MQAVYGLRAEAPVWDNLAIRGKSIHFWGCGPGIYEYLFSEKYLPGCAIGSDSQADSIAEATTQYHGKTLSFQEHDATQPFTRDFDLNIERFLLIQLAEDKAKQVVNNMAACTRAGGFVVLIEYVNSFLQCVPECNALHLLGKEMRARFANRGTDPDLGLKLPALLEGAGLTNISMYEVPYRTQGSDFSTPIVINGGNFGTPATIWAHSHTKRYSESHQQEVSDFVTWLNNAALSNSNHLLGLSYRIAVGQRL